MTSQNRHLPPPQTVNDFYAAALLDKLDALHNLLNDRLPALPAAGGPVEVQEPAPPPEPDGAVAVQEPAPKRPYTRKKRTT